MTQSRWLKLLSLSTTLLIPACMDATDEDVGPADDGTAVHLMPMHDPDAKVAKGYENFKGMMPKNFGEQLSAKQLEILVNFLASQK